MSKHENRRFRFKPRALTRLLTMTAAVMVAALVGGLAVPSQAASIAAAPLRPQVSMGQLGNMSVLRAADGSGDVTFTLDMGADFDAVRVRQELAEAESKGLKPSEILAAAVKDNPSTLTLPDTEPGPDFEGTFAVTDTAVSLTVDGLELHTEAGFWAGVGAVVAGTFVNLVFRAFCVGTLVALTGPELLPISNAACAFVASLLGTVTQKGIIISIDGGSLSALNWGDAVMTALITAFGAAAWEQWVGKWAKEVLSGYIETLGNAVILWSKTTWAFLRPAAGRVGTWLVEYVPAIRRAAEQAGLSTVPDFGQQIAVASYIHPGGDPGAWDRLIASPSDKVSVVVANVLNGPDSVRNDAWAGVIDRSKASGKKVLGYVPTGYLGQTGIRTRLGSTELADWVAQIEQDVNMWYALYGDSIGGIVFDEGFNECGADNEFPNVYSALNQYEKIRHPGGMTVVNPGTIVPQCYEDSADVLMTYESDYAAYYGTNTNAALNYKDLGWTPKDPSKLWHIIYDVPADQVARVAATALERGAGYIEITDDVLANPYDTLPAAGYWSTQEAAVAGGSPRVAGAAPYAEEPLSWPSCPTF